MTAVQLRGLGLLLLSCEERKEVKRREGGGKEEGGKREGRGRREKGGAKGEERGRR